MEWRSRVLQPLVEEIRHRLELDAPLLLALDEVRDVRVAQHGDDEVGEEEHAQHDHDLPQHATGAARTPWAARNAGGEGGWCQTRGRPCGAGRAG
eukprot:6363158-Prymnesium_polylepis.1